MNVWVKTRPGPSPSLTWLVAAGHAFPYPTACTATVGTEAALTNVIA
jgi:hypothetical protein